MSLKVTCPLCREPFSVRADKLPTKFTCPSCDRIVRVVQIAPGRNRLPAEAQVRVSRTIFGRVRIHYPCPNCSEPLVSPLDDAGNDDACPQCGVAFLVPGAEHGEVRNAAFRLESRAIRRERDRSQKKIERENTKAARQRRREESAARKRQENAAARVQYQQLLRDSQLRPCPRCGAATNRRAPTCQTCSAPLHSGRNALIVALACMGLLPLLLLVTCSFVLTPPKSTRSVVPRTASPTSAKLLQSEVREFISPRDGQRLPMAYVTWKNTGMTPIRVVRADIVHVDSRGNVLDAVKDYTIYAAWNDSPGVQPGETYTDPPGRGYILTPQLGSPNLRETSLLVRLTAVREYSSL